MGWGGGVNYNFVDLGLPSGLLWADRNIGAATPEDAGLFFQWGDTQGYTAEQITQGEKQFTEGDDKFSIGGTTYNFSKYNSNDGKTVLDLEDDAAHVLMGGNWRMPTNEDFMELINNTDLYLVPESGEEIHGTIDITEQLRGEFKWDYRTRFDIKGMKFYSKNNSSVYMFAPVTGYARNGSIATQSGNGSCNLWSSSKGPDYENEVFSFYFDMGSGYLSDTLIDRYYGCNIRAVFAQ